MAWCWVNTVLSRQPRYGSGGLWAQRSPVYCTGTEKAALTRKRSLLCPTGNVTRCCETDDAAKYCSPLLLSTSFLDGLPQPHETLEVQLCKTETGLKLSPRVKLFRLHKTVISPLWYAHFIRHVKEQHLSPSQCFYSWVWKCTLGQPWITCFIHLPLAKQLLWISRDTPSQNPPSKSRANAAVHLFHIASQPHQKKQGQAGTAATTTSDCRNKGIQSIPREAGICGRFGNLQKSKST